MVRTQIQLTADQNRKLKELAVRRGVSISELIRQGVDVILAQVNDRSLDDLYTRAARTAGRFSSGKKDVAVRHDDYLSEMGSS